MTTRKTTYFSAAKNPTDVITVDGPGAFPLLLAPHETAARQWGDKLSVAPPRCLSPSMIPQKLPRMRATSLIIVAPKYLTLTSEQAMQILAVFAAFVSDISELRETILPLIDDSKDPTL